MDENKKSCFLYTNLADFRNVGLIIRNIVDFEQIFVGNYSNTFKKDVNWITMSKVYTKQPSNFRYSESTLEEEIEKYKNIGYRIIILETENWDTLLPTISFRDFKETTEVPTLYIFGNEKNGVPKLLQKYEPYVLTLGDYSQTVSAIAIRIDTLLRYSI